MEKFSEISEELKRQIKEILEKEREKKLNSQVAENYFSIKKTFQELDPRSLRSQQFRDKISAWNELLEEEKVERNLRRDILTGVVLATVFYEVKEEKGGG